MEPRPNQESRCDDETQSTRVRSCCRYLLQLSFNELSLPGDEVTCLISFTTRSFQLTVNRRHVTLQLRRLTTPTHSPYLNRTIGYYMADKPFNGLFSRTGQAVRIERLNQSDSNETRDDRVAVAPAESYANHLHLAPDR